MKESYTSGRLELVLDSDEIVPDDPGAGTPAMVYLTQGQKVFGSTFWWAMNEGTILTNGEDIELASAELDWLEGMEDTVDDFIRENSP